jgi:MFS family permease
MHRQRLMLFLYISFNASVQVGAIIPLFSMIAYQQNIAPNLSGLVAAMTPLGGLVITFFSEKIVVRWGFQRTILIGLCGNLVLFLVLWWQPVSLTSWLITRFFMGMMFSLTFMPAQTSIGIEAQSKRAFYVNLIGVVFVIGLAIGPFLTNLITFSVQTVLTTFVVLQLLSLIAVKWITNTYPPQIQIDQAPISRWRLLPRMWIALLPALLFGCVELSLLSLFPQEALAKQLTIAQISIIVAMFSFSALCCQIPISLLADKFTPRRVALMLYPLIVGIVIIPLWAFSFWSLLGVSMGLGILIGHGYYFSVAYVNSIVQPEYLVKSNIMVEFMYNVITIVIPITIGYYLNTINQATIFLPLAIASVVVCLLHFIFSKRMEVSRIS